MAKDAHGDEDPAASMLKILLDQAEDLDLTDPTIPKEEQKNPGDLMVPGLEMSKLLAVIEFGLLHSADEEGILEGLDMISREQVMKQVNGTFQLNIKPSPGSGCKDEVYHFYVDLRKTGEIRPGPAPKRPKPDVVMTVSDKDMVALSMGKLNPQMAFLKGKIKVKGNIMLGLRLQTVLLTEMNKLQRTAKL
ncbi:uncharacterized protein PFL1_06116 [Pseudozyma flocculosa PF-1]|uniref:SCP2 domain-containing protein n=2 Tax=Pseudozyma flocculosa TaxID=84751 RepID=A0A5C3F4S5_9BASI|nr:uncharacterized protein PFL1_06116 [Pseudozyma flocculosa PF-1]EPQ26468.1 hypothetical protein PFL1_06116 [Pseudozyma flocculosa PF-1]SPO38935.1 uncharacterized protein PSFLO_04414 [Pseudozyma flocculosa]